MTSQKSPHLLAGAVMIAVLLSTALVSPLYPLYQARWGLTPGDITQIYVIYMCGSVVTLLFLGRLPDRIGWRRVLIGAIVLGLIGAAWSAFAPSPGQFAAARFLIGVSGSLATGAGSVALMRLTPEDKRGNIPFVNSFLLAVGFGLGPVIGGVAGQWLPAPLVSAHVLPFVAVLVALALVLFGLPTDSTPRTPVRFTDLLPKLAWVARPNGKRLALTCALPFLVFGAFGMSASMAPLMIREMLGFGGPFITGLYIAIFLTVSALSMIPARRFEAQSLASFGLVSLALGAVAMIANLQVTSPLLFGLGTLGGALGHGTLALAGTSRLLRLSTPQTRGALTATYWSIGYSGSIFPLLLAGQAADIWGSAIAVTGFYTVMGLLSLAVLVLTRLQSAEEK